MNKLNQVILAALVLGAVFLSGCYHETYSQSAAIREVDFEGYKFELAISHNYSSYSPGHPATSGQRTIWIYTKRRIGKVPADEILVSSTQAHDSHPLGILAGKRGSVELLEMRLNVDLELGIYDDHDVIGKYVPAQFNGTYEITFVQ